MRLMQALNGVKYEIQAQGRTGMGRLVGCFKQKLPARRDADRLYRLLAAVAEAPAGRAAAPSAGCARLPCGACCGSLPGPGCGALPQLSPSVLTGREPNSAISEAGAAMNTFRARQLAWCGLGRHLVPGLVSVTWFSPS